jgi:hypothetical protein
MEFLSSGSVLRRYLSGVLTIAFGLGCATAWPIGSVAVPTPAMPSPSPSVTASPSAAPSSSSPVPTPIGTPPTPEQIAQIDRKLLGTWSVVNLNCHDKGPDENAMFVSRLAFRANQEIETGIYWFGRLSKSSKSKINYRIISIRNVESLQLIELKFSKIVMSEISEDDAMTPESLGGLTYVISFQGDRQLNLHSVNGEYVHQDLMQSIPLLRKASDTTDIVDWIPFRADSNHFAQLEAEYNLDLALKAQQAYRSTHQKYATDFSQLEDLQELSTGNEFYNYRITIVEPNRSIVKVIPKNKGLKSYAGISYSLDGKTRITGICRSHKPTMKTIANPTLKIKKSDSVVIQCPQGSSQM